MDKQLKRDMLGVISAVLAMALLIALWGFILQVANFQNTRQDKIELTIEERKAAYIRAFINSCSSFTVKTAEDYMAKNDMPYLECTNDRLINEIGDR